MIPNYDFATAILNEYRAETEKAATSAKARRGLAVDGDRILAFAQVHATLAVADALKDAKATK